MLKYFTHARTHTNSTTQFTSYFLEDSNLSRKVKTILKISKCQPGNTITHVLERTYVPPALNTGTCINHRERQAG